MPTVSVVIPCYNVAPHIERAIRSVQSQTLQVKEIICVDDGSSDDSLAVLERMRRSSPVSIEIASLRHSGSAAARNEGLNRASGDLIQFLDADDVLLPQKIEHQSVLYDNSSKNATLVAGSFLDIPKAGLPRFIGSKFQNPWANLIYSGLGVTSSNLWQRQAVLEIGGWNENQSASQEYELMFRLLQQNSTVLLSHAPLTEKYQVSGSIQSIGENSEQRRNAILSFILLRRSISEYLNSKGMLSEEIRDLHLTLMHWKLKSLAVYDKKLAHDMHRQDIPPGYRLPTVDGSGILAIDNLKLGS